MKTKSVLYAAVGAPVVAARKVGTKANDVYGKLNEQASGYSKTAGQAIDGWAVEGEKVVISVKERKVVDEITAKVDLDQAKEQVSKLRDQLEDMLATWRSSFRPEKAESKTTPPATNKTETKAPASKKTGTKTAATKEPAPKATATKATATKATATKATATKATAAKTTKTTAKEPATKTSPKKSTPASKTEKAS